MLLPKIIQTTVAGKKMTLFFHIQDIAYVSVVDSDVFELDQYFFKRNSK